MMSQQQKKPQLGEQTCVDTLHKCNLNKQREKLIQCNFQNLAGRFQGRTELWIYEQLNVI